MECRAHVDALLNFLVYLVAYPSLVLSLALLLDIE